MISKFKDLLEEYNWIGTVLFSIILWLIIGVFSSSFKIATLFNNMSTASYLVIPALGQMLVICTGRGAIDLSIPSIITLSAFLATGIIDGSNLNIIYGLPLVLIIGILIGVINSFFIVQLKIPPIITTLGMSYIVTTFILLYNQNFSAFKIAPLLQGVTRNRLLNIPLIVYFSIFCISLITFSLRKTVYGKSVIALGQNIIAAKFAGVKTDFIQYFTYGLSGMLAALTGILLSARVGGAFLGMGDEYLLSTIGAVVLGGTPILGGKACPLGTFWGALFLILLVSLLQIIGVSIGMQNIIKGSLILFVVFLSKSINTKN